MAGPGSGNAIVGVIKFTNSGSYYKIFLVEFYFIYSLDLLDEIFPLYLFYNLRSDAGVVPDYLLLDNRL